MNIFNLNQNLLLEEPALKVIESPFQRFYTYRAKAEFPDIDRSYTAKDVYRKLKWYDERKDKKLEPDTFFASSHNLIHELFNKYDKHYYVNDFKKFCITKEIDYNALANKEALYYRYLWMIEPNVMSHYDFILINPSLLDYIETTHEIGNFMIIPKGFGWEPKCKFFNESPVKSLYDLEHNWKKYSDNYRLIESFEQLKVLFLLEDFYLENGMLNTTLDIDFRNNSFTEIFNKMQILSNHIRIRTRKITLRLERIA